MAVTKPEVEWFRDPHNFWQVYGLINLPGKWAVVKSNSLLDDDYDILTEWLPDRGTAIGFLKLLKEK